MKQFVSTICFLLMLITSGFAAQLDLIQDQKPTIQIISDNLQIIPKQIVEVNQGLAYSIHIYYPLIIGSDMPDIARNFNLAAQQVVQHVLSQFKSRYASQIRLNLGKNNYYLRINYQVFGATSQSQQANYVEILFNIDRFSPGMNSAEHTSAVLNFDFGARKNVLLLSDLFKPNTLPIFAEFCRKQLLAKQNPDLSLINQGTAPILSNYQTWYIDENSDLHIIFKAGQVAPQKAGEQIIIIPQKIMLPYFTRQATCVFSKYERCDTT